jgi:NADPH-dependent 2,4-dienoyl-CoA reductase/sulfur reductase-like enzyme
MSLAGNTGYTPDPASVQGKQPPIDEQTDLLVIGAGPAGMAAALAAAGHGVRVTLVDENPVPLASMGEEVPLHFGARMDATVANRNAMLESILEANPRLADAMDAGVDVRLGTAVWGVFPCNATRRWAADHVAGLTDAERAYLLRFRQVIVAAGRRDMGLAFDGWQLAGVMGASAAWRLTKLYRALDARTAVLVGSTAETLQVGQALSEAGVRIAAVVEQAGAPAGPAQLLDRLRSGGTQLLTSHVVQQALGDAHGVRAVRLASVGGGAERPDDAPATIDCDTIVLGIEAVPAIELLEASGCAVRFDAARGGHVPVIDETQRTSLPFMYAIGDCAGVWASKSLAEDIVSREAQIAVGAALRALGAQVDAGRQPAPVVPDRPARDIAGTRLAWVRASMAHAAGATKICQCEEVTAAQLLSLQPPGYLGWSRQIGPHGSCHEGGGAVSPDLVKRLTRAGMGPCQGRRCREQIAALLALESNVALEAVPLATYRAPVRPQRLDVLAAMPESSALGAHWDSWFGMASQWIPFWRIGPDGSLAECGAGEPVTGE